jgi:hypothetical protein
LLDQLNGGGHSSPADADGGTVQASPFAATAMPVRGPGSADIVSAKNACFAQLFVATMVSTARCRPPQAGAAARGGDGAGIGVDSPGLFGGIEPLGQQLQQMVCRRSQLQLSYDSARLLVCLVCARAMWCMGSPVPTWSVHIRCVQITVIIVQGNLGEMMGQVQTLAEINPQAAQQAASMGRGLVSRADMHSWFGAIFLL